MENSVAHLQANVASDGQPMASRSLSSSPLGKLTAEVKGFKVDEDTHDELARLSREAGYGSVQEFVRALVMIRVHGVDTLAKLHADRLKVVAGKSTE